MSTSAQWYVARGTQSVGPMSFEQLLVQLRSAGGLDGFVYGPGLNEWTKARHVGMIAEAFVGRAVPPTPPEGRQADEIDYEIFGEEMQYVEVTLDPGEMVIAEAGGMMYMTPEHPAWKPSSAIPRASRRPLGQGAHGR